LINKLKEMDNYDPENRLKDSEPEVSNLSTEIIASNWHREKSFRKAIENAIPSGIIVVDNTGKQVYANKSFCKMIGWEEEELIDKKPPFVYWSQQDIENINNAMRLTLDNSAPKEGFDLVFCSKTGTLIPVNVIISPIVHEDNRIFWLANIIDITGRKKEEEELLISQLLLRSSMENQKGTIIFAIDKNYHYLFFNKDHSDSMKYAYKKDVETGMNILDYITEENDRKLAKANYDRALRGESHSVIQSFGEVNTAYYESFFNPIINEKGKVIGCTGLARNITERKRAEQILKESETKFKEIINQINDGIIVFNELGKIIIWNNGATKISGLKSEETIGRNIIDVRYQFTPPSVRDRAQIEKNIKGIITLQNPESFNKIIEDEIVSLNPPYTRNIQTTVFPVSLEGYNLFCAVIRDTTELKRYENELMRISAEKDKFYSVIAQYLYTPFNLFSSFSKIMAEELDTLPIKEIQKMAEMMSKSATNLYSLLDNMLQWTKMSQGKIVFSPQKLNFLELGKDAISILKPNAKAKNITININTDREITVFADIFMLKTILRNLVLNSIKDANNDGIVDISAQVTPTAVLISVSDDGVGIRANYLKTLFDTSEIHSTLDKSEEKGLTLGLILCKEFVEKHGGKIWAVDAKQGGPGAEIKFTIPIFNNKSEEIKI
jgi:PAS domain S-box-containing protein